jgi:lipoprotein-releasing system ATP-binding protein
MSENAMVLVEKLTKTFTDDAGQFDVLREATFTINRGEMVALVGVSGAGKTTLLQIVGGLDRASSGSVIVAGQQLHGMSGRDLARFRGANIGFVFQFHHLLPDFTALENVLIPGMIKRSGKKEGIDRARELLSLMGLERRLSHFPSELSGGERQRVALARALFNEPALVLADEPTGNLDTANSRLLIELFHKANEKTGQTFLIASHDDNIAKSMRRTVFIEDGKTLSA